MENEFEISSGGDIKKSRFIRKEDIGNGLVVTIKGITKENVAPANQKEDRKVCVHFVELEKPIVLNLINYNSIAQITGSEKSGGWLGKKIELWYDKTVAFGGEIKGGIRVRPVKQ
jgi:hypothetical protein